MQVNPAGSMEQFCGRWLFSGAANTTYCKGCIGVHIPVTGQTDRPICGRNEKGVDSLVSGGVSCKGMQEKAVMGAS
jgi:hypothetical protein